MSTYKQFIISQCCESNVIMPSHLIRKIIAETMSQVSSDGNFDIPNWDAEMKISSPDQVVLAMIVDDNITLVLERYVSNSSLKNFFESLFS